MGIFEWWVTVMASVATSWLPYMLTLKFYRMISPVKGIGQEDITNFELTGNSRVFDIVTRAANYLGADKKNIMIVLTPRIELTVAIHYKSLTNPIVLKHLFNVGLDDQRIIEIVNEQKDLIVVNPEFDDMIIHEVSHLSGNRMNNMAYYWLQEKTFWIRNFSHDWVIPFFAANLGVIGCVNSNLAWICQAIVGAMIAIYIPFIFEETIAFISTLRSIKKFGMANATLIARNIASYLTQYKGVISTTIAFVMAWITSGLFI